MTYPKSFLATIIFASFTQTSAQRVKGTWMSHLTNNVTVAWVKQLRESGYIRLTADRLASMRIHGENE